jgi:SAM-dependent methyltransferase
MNSKTASAGGPSPGSPDRPSLIDDIERLGPWHHDVEVAPGVTTAGIRRSAHPDEQFADHYSPDAMMRPLVGNLYPQGMQGRSFLDCACNSGGHSVAAARLGAGRTFAFDARQLWVDQAEFLARRVPVPDMSVRRCELKDLPGLRLEPFDVTLFAGIFYHLPDPIAGLRIAADLTKELLIVNTAVLPRWNAALIPNIESDTDVLSGVDQLAWLPTGPDVMRKILAWCGFPHTRLDQYWRYGGDGWRRLQILAARDEAVFTDYDRVRPAASAPPGMIRRELARVARRIFR